MRQSSPALIRRDPDAGGEAGAEGTPPPPVYVGALGAWASSARARHPRFALLKAAPHRVRRPVCLAEAGGQPDREGRESTARSEAAVAEADVRPISTSSRRIRSRATASQSRSAVEARRPAGGRRER